MRKVVITGMGAISALGHDAAACWREMLAGRSAIGPIRAVAGELLRAPVAAEVSRFDPAAHFDSKRLPLLDRVSQFATTAACIRSPSCGSWPMRRPAISASNTA
jgi:nodulation protein E